MKGSINEVANVLERASYKVRLYCFNSFLNDGLGSMCPRVDPFGFLIAGSIDPAGEFLPNEEFIHSHVFPFRRFEGKKDEPSIL